MKTTELEKFDLIELGFCEMKEVNGGIGVITFPSPIIIEDFGPELKW